MPNGIGLNTGRKDVCRQALLAGVLFLAAVVSAGPQPGLNADIEYGRAQDRALLLDVYVPQGEQLRPGVILIHGGGWGSGSRQDMAFLAEPLVKEGFACFSVEYRLAPEHRWPACIEDVRTAIRWIKANGLAYRADPDRQALIGYSAGGHLACFAAVQADETERVQAVVALAAPTDLEADCQRRGQVSPALQNLFGCPPSLDESIRQHLRETSPLTYVNAGLPPFLLIHGTEDASVPYDQSIQFKAKLTHYNAPCELITIPGAGHRISEWPAKRPDYLSEMTSWLRQMLNLQRSERAEGTVPGDSVWVIKVSPNGSDEFRSVQAAVDFILDGNVRPVCIRIAPGVYKEKIVVPRSKPGITFLGTNAEQTILSFGLYAGIKDAEGNEIGTFRTPSVTVEADDFTAENITFENSAGPVGQAVAAAVFGDRVIFRNCRFLGWQDTLLDNLGRHYYDHCTIVGDCDFVFGGGTAFFDRCRIHCLRSSYITAASTPQREPYGYVFSNCTITGREGVTSYLGRPWRDYAGVIFLNTEMAAVIRPQGWHNWGKPEREETARYAEFNCTGPGADSQARIGWARQLTAEEAQAITIRTVLAGQDGWDPAVQGAARQAIRQQRSEQIAR